MIKTIFTKSISSLISNSKLLNFKPAQWKTATGQKPTKKGLEPVIKQYKKKEKKEEIGDPIVMDYVLEKIQSTNDPEVLSKISSILDQIEKRQMDKQTRTVSTLNTHPDVLSETDVYKVVQSLVDSPEEKLIKSIKNNLPIEASLWKKNIKKRIISIPTYQMLRLLRAIFDLEYNRGNKVSENSTQNKENEDIQEEDNNEDEDDIEQELNRNQKLPAEVKTMCNSIWNTVQSEFRRRIKMMSIDEIARTVRLYAHANKSNPEFFRDIENEIFERDLEYIPYKSIGMILEGFSHANLGSATLYSNMARTIKVAASEIQPIQLAKYAYYFSKSSENILGGFGVYKITEQKLTLAIELMEFSELIRVAFYLLQQNIGSNTFLSQLEKRLIEAYPPKQYGGISPNQLTKLVKSTSKHYFTFNDKALFHMLEADVTKQVPYMTPQQISTVLWSYSRSRRGNPDLYQAIEEAVLKNIKKLSSRSLAFAYYQFSFSRKGSAQLYQKIEERISQLGIEQFQGHYLVKILTGMNMRNSLDSLRESLLLPILKHMRNKSSSSKYSEAIQFLYLLVELPPYQLEGSEVNIHKEYESLFSEFEVSKFTPITHLLKIDEVSQLYFAYRSANAGSLEFLQNLERRLQNQTEVPKPYFAKVIFSLAEHLQFDMAKEFIPIIKELTKYGDIKYFFSHDDFIRLIWSMLLVEQAGQNQKDLDAKYQMGRDFWLEETYDALFSINPNTLKFTSLPLWVQSVCMLTQSKINMKKKFQSAQKEQLMSKLIDKVDQIDAEYKQEYIKRDLNQLTSIKQQMFNCLKERMNEFSNNASLNYELVVDLVDEFLNVVDISLLLKHEEEVVKIGVIILNQHHYSGKDFKQGHENLLLSIQNKISLLQTMLNWSIIVIDSHEWVQLSEQQQLDFFYQNISIDAQSINSSPQQQQQPQQQQEQQVINNSNLEQGQQKDEVHHSSKSSNENEENLKIKIEPKENN